MAFDSKIVKGIVFAMNNKQVRKDNTLYDRILDYIVEDNNIDIENNYGDFLEEDVLKVVKNITGVNIPVSMFKRYMVHILSAGDSYVDITRDNFDISVRLLKCISGFNIVNYGGSKHLAFNRPLVELRAHDIASDVIAYFMGIYRKDETVCINRRDKNGAELITVHGIIEVPKDSIYSARMAMCDIRDRYKSEYFGEAFRRLCVAEV